MKGTAWDPSEERMYREVTIIVKQEKTGPDRTIGEFNVKVKGNATPTPFDVSFGDLPLGNYYVEMQVNDDDYDYDFWNFSGSGKFYLDE
ncbi:hypothetical protein [Paenibacillus tyrfis]|uniref:Uncharacterized protein n=1 Tax=Paenibacillus tyrfis TaxID=1501230 RepID=A0A081PAR1_9BACL|nr:hypothetical protein [Paenibacillus tyrfis]KEQ27784.1 hypothetical protein ET33_14015 [Paenibacillus tyrfis]